MRATRKKACFVILNYNDFETTKKLVNSIHKWERDCYQIIIVDNQSTDESYKTLDNCYKGYENIDVLISEKNGGYSYGNNFGADFAIKKYNPEYIVISNPDIEIEMSTFDELLRTFDVDESIAMVSPVMKSINGEYKIYSQRLPNYMDDLRACFNSSKSRTIKEEFEYVNGDTRLIRTQMLPGSFFVVRTKCFAEVGMFDENVFLFCEERILGRKMHEQKYKLILRKDLFFVHQHSVTMKKTYDIIAQWKFIMKSRLYYEEKYNKIPLFQSIILKICMKLFLIILNIKLVIYQKLRG